MRFFVTGRDGQLGRCLTERLRKDSEHALVRATSRATLDLCRADAVSRELADLADSVDVLVNAAAFTAVDRCESELELAQRVNGEAPAQLAELCRDAGVGLVHISTDYVFDGSATQPYGEDAPTGPTSAYGRTKLTGERAVLDTSAEFLVVRTSWVFGPGQNFVKAILRQARLRRSGEVVGPLRVVDDQRGCPTYADDLACAVLALVGRGARGLVHVSNAEPATWWDFARSILDRTGYADLEIERGSTEALDLAAPRPRYSVLDCSRAAALGVSLRPWNEALDAYLQSADGLAAREGT